MTRLPPWICEFLVRLVYVSSWLLLQPLPPTPVSKVHLDASGEDPSAPLNSSLQTSLKPAAGGGWSVAPPPQLSDKTDAARRMGTNERVRAARRAFMRTILTRRRAGNATIRQDSRRA